jgi:hypothetical protein
MMAKKVNVRRKKKRNFGKIIGVVSLVTVMIVIITLSALHQITLQPPPPPPIPKKLASEYFSFSKVLATATAIDETNRSIFIYEVEFYITAVGGNATDMWVLPTQGYVEIQNSPYFSEITQNQSVRVFIEYPNKVFSIRKDEGYPIYFNIICIEAKGKVTLYITEFYTY